VSKRRTARLASEGRTDRMTVLKRTCNTGEDNDNDVTRCFPIMSSISWKKSAPSLRYMYTDRDICQPLRLCRLQSRPQSLLTAVSFLQLTVSFRTAQYRELLSRTVLYVAHRRVMLYRIAVLPCLGLTQDRRAGGVVAQYVSGLLTTRRSPKSGGVS
jgi:hypothetical protein